MEIIVFGAGSLGSVIGAYLTRIHEVTLIGREPHVAAIEANGLRVTGEASFTVTPAARTDLEAATADLALVTVKSYDTPAAAAALRAGSFDAVLSLQNGLGNEAALAESLDAPILGGTTTYGADLVEPGVVAQTGTGRILLGWYTDDGSASQLAHIVEGFDQAGLAVTRTTAIRHALWRKVAVNAAINPITALVGCRNGAITEPPLSEVADRVVAEIVDAAAAAEIELSIESLQAEVTEVASATADNRSSMLQDVLAGSQTEIEAIAGIPLEHGSRASMPVTATLYDLVRGWERANDVGPD